MAGPSGGGDASAWLQQRSLLPPHLPRTYSHSPYVIINTSGGKRGTVIGKKRERADEGLSVGELFLMLVHQRVLF